MYLNLLKEEEKKNFIELAYYIANCDRNFAAIECYQMDQYWKETGIDKTSYQIQNLELDAILENLKDSTRKSKTTIFLEIMGLVLSDFEFNGMEQKAVSKLRAAWNISDEKYRDILKFYEGMEMTWKIV